ncbi:peptidase M48 [Desulfosarcina alkanivorans]|uniref:Peptidase M48 n=1 Tax=Desulfosarcina alkanivorans TaxID=571177 RepID=A0A5K7YE96_9BACT|nr:M48 family metallopeptidase [Desulfosarcina alkanivorans]BBO67336.1 peptidase M48 [Desulfosarcina alkanivorans]
MNWIAWTILFFLSADFLLHLLADRLNLGAISDRIPLPFEGRFDPQTYRQSQAYLRANTRFGQTTAAVDLLVLLAFWFGGGFAIVDDWTRSLGWGPLATGLAYIGLLSGLKTLVDQPFRLYATFVIEQRFGFNTTTITTWVKDRLKGLFLIILLGVPLLSGVLAFFHHTGTTAWIWCWGLVTAFMIVVQFVAPTWIMPLFNRFEPLTDGELKAAIMAYARSIGFSLNNIQVMDGSRRSSKSNAFFTGFGRHRRIVLFDTLIARHTTDELVAVLAHEMGHYQMRHIWKMMAAGILQTGVLLYFMSLIIGTPALFEAFFVTHPSIHAGLVFFGLLYAPVDFFLGLLVQHISRRHEFAADHFAATTTGGSRSMVEALKKLSVHNLSNLTPHPLHVFLNYSHPPVLDRIAALEGGKSEDGN